MLISDWSSYVCSSDLLFSLLGLSVGAAGLAGNAKCIAAVIVGCRDGDAADLGFRSRTLQIHMQQSVAELGPDHVDAVRQDKAALELARCDAAMQIHPILVVGLSPAEIGRAHV